jgi:hypothetical protein
MAVFVFERACDLLFILALSLLAADVLPTIGVLCLTVLAFTGTVFAVAAWTPGVRMIECLGQQLPGRILHMRLF